MKGKQVYYCKVDNLAWVGEENTCPECKNKGQECGEIFSV